LVLGRNRRTIQAPKGKAVVSDITKLPKWAQERIRDLERQRDVAVKTLNQFQDSQTPSPVFYREFVCTGETDGSSEKIGYIQASVIEFTHAGVFLRVMLSREKDPSRDFGIELSWSNTDRHSAQVAFIPKSYQQAQLVAKENMR